jgi:hypothetical protein
MGVLRSRIRTVGLALIASAVGAGCASDKQPPHDPRPASAPKTAQVPAGPANLDAFGNLLGSEDIVLGFEMPMGAEKTKLGGAGRYLETTIARMERFFTSRGYGVETLRHGWQLSHTARTLKRYGSPDQEDLAKATAYVTRGPGPGLSVIFDSGVPRDLAKPVVQDLLDAERALATGATGAASPPATAPTPRAPGEPPAGMVKVGPTGSTRPTAQRPKSLERFELQRLRSAAVNRKPADPKASDMSKRVLEWSKANEGKPFLD